jgi:hypothetical protein
MTTTTERATAAFVHTANRLPTLYDLSAEAMALLALQDIPDDKTAKFTFRLQANPKSVVVLDEAAVSSAFKVVSVTVSKTAIKDHIRATGEIPPGVEWASSGDSLRVT